MFTPNSNQYHNFVQFEGTNKFSSISELNLGFSILDNLKFKSSLSCVTLSIPIMTLVILELDKTNDRALS